MELAGAYLARIDRVQMFYRTCRELEMASQETLLLATLDGLDVVYLARHDGTQPIRLASDIGRRLPAVASALGKAMLAQLPDDDLERRLDDLDELPILTDKSHRTKSQLLADLQTIRERGYSIDDEQNTDGVVCYSRALPVHGPESRHFAVSVMPLKARETEDLEHALVDDLDQLVHRLPASIPISGV